MHGIPALLDQSEDPIEATGISGHAERSHGNQTVGGETYDVGEIKLFESIIVRDVEKTGVRLNASSWRSCQSYAAGNVRFVTTQPSWNGSWKPPC